MRIRQIGNFLLNAVFPQFCVQCGRLGTLLCSACYADIEFYRFSVKLDLETSYLTSVSAATYYEGPIQALIKALKYQSVIAAAATCARLMAYGATAPDCDLVVPVPLHPRRQRERGFNQAAQIARELARLNGLPYQDLLIRRRYLLPQAQVADRALRLTRLQNSFMLSPGLANTAPSLLTPATRVLLIDDVCTTGSTLNECARVLKLAGAPEVHAMTVAHGG